ncbi:hypothetical protein BCR34DRAFT_583438 [Clohesyomyces aquaticus]|uniref:CHAT domain-containing protein n=1 Tax=Clohesyomyces aquaticus TaxID=1231657 RepID=A0A1Y2A762_9PLEO|nr:hypothetical protein BCR34DRAFT_583438 [Clohesyomyces aquaticus]
MGPDKSNKETLAPNGCPLSVQCGTTDQSSSISEDVMCNLTRANRAIEWYMEKFITDQPFDVPRAEAISSSLVEYAAHLIEALRLPVILPEWDVSSHIVLSIKETTSAERTSSLNALRWEILQDVKLWPEEREPASVAVVRVVDQLEQLVDTGIAPVKSIAKFNILAVTARPRGVKDIPHRLITKEICDSVTRANAEDNGKTPRARLDIVRPGTLGALAAQLNKKGEKVYAQFIKPGGQGADNVSADALARLLRTHGVQTVVLNACRSAFEGGEGGGPEANLAKALIQSGIKTAVAMAYNVTDVAAKLFIRIFYDQLLCHNASPLLAVQAARRCLMDNRIRRTKYQTEAAVDDYLVPSIYMPHCTSRDVESYNLAAFPQNPALSTMEDVEEDDTELVGREGDMLELETSLLVHSSVLGINGSPGVGKSAFVRHAASWWKSTKFIDKFIEIDLSSIGLDSLATAFKKEVGIDLSMEAKTRGGNLGMMSKIKKALRTNVLILVDGAEGRGSRKISDSNLQILNAFLSDFFRYTHRYRVHIEEHDEDDGSPATTSVYRSFVLVSARHMPKLDILSTGDRVHTLSPLDEGHALTLTSRLLRKSGKPLDIRDYESLLAAEHFGKLAQGNPTAMRILAHDYCAQETGILDYLKLLFQGDRMGICSFPPDLILHPATRDIRRLLDGSSSTTLSRDFLLFFAPALVETFISYWVQIQHSEDEEEEGELSRLQNGLVEVLFQIQEEGFASEGAYESAKLGSGQDESSGFEYITLHPLVPLVAREGWVTRPPKLLADGLSIPVLPSVYMDRTEPWPSTKMYWHKEWDGPREALRWEFYNFLAAIYQGMTIEPLGIFIMKIATLVHCAMKGLFWDRTRRPLIATFCKYAVVKLEQQKALSKQNRGGLPDSDAIDYKMFTINFERAQLAFLLILCEYYSGWNEEEVQYCMDRMTLIYRIRTTMPQYDPVRQEFGRIVRELIASQPITSPANNFGPVQMQAKAEARKRVYDSFRATGSDVAGYDTGGIFKDIGGGSVLGRGNALEGPDSEIRGAVLMAKRKMERASLEEAEILAARDILYHALSKDLQLGENPMNRVTVHRALSEDVEEKAAKHYEQKFQGKKSAPEVTDVKGRKKVPGETQAVLTVQYNEVQGDTDDRIELQSVERGGGKSDEIMGNYQQETDAEGHDPIRSHWHQALYHMMQALQIEDEIGIAKSNTENERDKARADYLTRKAAGIDVVEPTETQTVEPLAREKRWRCSRCVLM